MHANVLTFTILLARSARCAFEPSHVPITAKVWTKNNSNLKAHSLLLRETPLYE